MGITKKHLKKKPRVAIANARTGGGLDRITSLHESLVSNILSRLDAVRTSILSKDWRHKWVLMDKVDTDSLGLSLAKFFDKMLISREHLRSFRATFWHNMSSVSVQKWIDAALRHNLEYLDVNINRHKIVIPSGLLNHTSLREVRVVQPSWVNISVEVKNCAPKLTSLSLYNILFVNTNLDSMTISFDFPVLETLEFRRIVFRYGGWRKRVKYVEINAPSLTSFSFRTYWPNGPYQIQGCEYTMKIVAPRLARFSCFKDIPENLILDGSSIVSAFLGTKYDLRILEYYASRVTDLVNGFINLEELTLSSSMAAALRIGPTNQCHDKLKRLTLLSGSNAYQLFKLLHAMPSLKFLSVNVDSLQDYDYEVMEITPSCIASCLEEVVLQVFSDNVPQYNLAEFLLKTAKKLKKFTITTNDVGLSEEMKNVLVFPPL